MEKSAYERRRDATVAENLAHLQSLGLEPLLSPTDARAAPKKRQRAVPAAGPTRMSKRTRSAAPDYTGDPIDAFGDDEATLKRKLRQSEGLRPASSVEHASSAVPPTRPAHRPKMPREVPPTVDFVRTFLEDRVPESHAIEERTMFGMAMWMVRGNMFLGVGLKSERLLVRVGEECVEEVLADHPTGVARCGAASGRVFSGTLMVEPEQYRGDARLATWFDLAMAYNKTMKAKEPNAKPVKAKALPKAVAPPAARAALGATHGTRAAGKSLHERALAQVTSGRVEDDDEVLEASDSDDEEHVEAAPRPRPPSTSGGAFARCVLHVVRSIPAGRVAAYGQVAALAGAPRNARQVGHLLREGLCDGGDPWFRVLGASGHVSLPSNGGGETQRALLEAEGVKFRPSGAVAPEMFWSRTTPLFT